MDSTDIVIALKQYFNSDLTNPLATHGLISYEKRGLEQAIEDMPELAKELQAYRAVGTIEEVQAMQAELAESRLNDSVVIQNMQKLQQYVDTGLSPEEVAELAQAKVENRLIVLPCKIGDSVYDLTFGYSRKIRELKVSRIIEYRNGEIGMYAECKMREAYYGAIYDTCKGRCNDSCSTLFNVTGCFPVYLSRAEAEAALAEMRGAE